MARIGNTLQTKLDLPLWYKAKLDASKKVQFYKTPGLNNISSIDQALTIDKTAQYTCDQIQISIMRSFDGAGPFAWDPPTIELLAKMISQTWFSFLKNGREYVWSIAAASLLKVPAAITAGPPATVYDISPSVQAMYTLQEPIIIPGGQALNITQEWEEASDFTGLTSQFCMFGILDRDIARGI